VRRVQGVFGSNDGMNVMEAVIVCFVRRFYETYMRMLEYEAFPLFSSAEVRRRTSGWDFILKALALEHLIR